MGEKVLTTFGIILLAAVVVAVVLGVFYVGNIFHFQEIVTQATGNLKLPNININGIATWLTQNPIIAGVVATLGTTAVTYLIKNYQTNKLLNQTQTELTKTVGELVTSETVSEKATAELDKIKKQNAELLETINSDTTTSALQEKVGLLTNKSQKLESDLQSIQNMHTNFLNSLTKAANGETIIDPLTQETLKVIKQVTTVVK